MIKDSEMPSDSAPQRGDTNNVCELKQLTTLRGKPRMSKTFIHSQISQGIRRRRSS